VLTGYREAIYYHVSDSGKATCDQDTHYYMVATRLVSSQRGEPTRIEGVGLSSVAAMMWLRRLLTIPPIISFVVWLVAALLVTQVNDMFASPGFYNDQMKQADVYNFIYDELLPAALEEIDADESMDVPVEMAPIEDEIISAARRILPPEWLEDQFESAANAVIPYIVDDTDSFAFTLVLRDRIDLASEVVKEDILRGDAFTSIREDGTSYVADEVLNDLDELPYSVTFTKEQVEDSLRRVITADWATGQVEAAIDSVMPYMTGDSSHFTITVYLQDRVDAAATAVIDLFSGQETYDYLLNEMIVPAVEVNLGSVVNLPFEVSLSQEEIVSAIKVALPESWVQARLTEVVHGVAAYVKGEADSIEVAVDLADRKATALSDLTASADEKLQDRFLSLPECSMEQFMQIVATLPPDTLPDCRPSGGSYQQFKDALNINIASSIDQLIGQPLPTQWVYTDADLRQSLGEGNEEFLDDLRDWVSDGWTFTDADLLDELDSDGEETLEDVRGWIKSGYTVTETDLRDAIADAEEDLNSFDDARRWIATGRTWLWGLWLVPFVILLFIGLLGGRNWKSKLIWALAVLLVSSLAIYIATAAIYSQVAEPRVEDIIDVSEYEGVDAVLAEKGNEVIENVASGFASGIKGKTLWMMIGSGVVLLGVIGWGMLGQHRQEEYRNRLRSACEYVRRRCSRLRS